MPGGSGSRATLRHGRRSMDASTLVGGPRPASCVRLGSMSTAVHEHVALPRWQRMLLPGELRDGARGRRSARDWVVDVAMYAIAAG